MAKRSTTSKSSTSASSSKKTTSKKSSSKKPTTKKPPAKKPAAKKTTTKKTTAKKPATKKTTAKKPAAKKSTTKKSTAKKPVTKKTTAKKPAAKKSTTKKTTAKKPAAKKSTTRKTTAKKPATKKTTTKKTSSKAADAGTKKSTSKKTATTTKKTTSKKSESKKTTTKKAESAKADASKKSTSKKKTETKKPARRRVGARSVAEAASEATADKDGYVFIKGRRVRMISTGGVGISRTKTAKTTEPEETKVDERPKKLKTTLTAKELRHYRDILMVKRAQVAGDLDASSTAAFDGSGGDVSRLPVHMADVGSDVYSQDLNLGLAETEAGRLKEINDALARIEDKTYGMCLLTGEPIPKARLDAKPWAKFTIESARRIERGEVLPPD